jgi:scyllo-inositol 2-dehydrogenase (NADP+)
MKKIRVGLVGIGRAGWGMHCKALEARQDKFEVTACCDIDVNRLNKMTERFPAIKRYSTIEELVADADIDLVDIATPSPLHAEHAIAAMQAGKTVFLEKPIATSLADAKRIVATSEETGIPVYFRHNRRFETPFQHIREIIASGKLGNVYEIRLHRHGYQRRADWQTLKSCGGGQLNNWGPHIIDHSLQFLDSPVKEIWSDLKLIAAAGDAEDHLKIVFKGENDRLVDMEISGGVAIGEPTYVAFGSKGSLVCKGKTIEIKYLDPFDKLSDLTPSPDAPPIDGSFGNQEKLRWITETFDADPKLSVSTEDIWDFLHDTLTTGVPFPIKTEEALKVMEVIEKVKANTDFA